MNTLRSVIIIECNSRDNCGDNCGRNHRHKDRKSTRLSSHRCISYAVFCLKKKKRNDPPVIEEGKPAQDLELESDSGQTVKLSDIRLRPTLLYIDTTNDTPSCTSKASGIPHI